MSPPRPYTRALYQLAFFAALALPAKSKAAKEARARFLVDKIAEKSEKRGPLGLAIALNALFITAMGTMTVRYANEKDLTAIEATIGDFFSSKPPAPPPSGGGDPLAQVVTDVSKMAPAQDPAPMLNVVSTMAPSALSFTAPSPKVSVDAGAAQGLVSRGNGIGSGGGSNGGTGPGSGGNGNGAGGNGNGIGGGSINGDNRIPIIVIYTSFDSIIWKGMAPNTGAKQMENMLADLRKTFNVVAETTVRGNNASYDITVGDTPMDNSPYKSTSLDGEMMTNAKLIWTMLQEHPEAKGVVFCAGWADDWDTTPQGQALGQELGRRINALGKRLFLMSFSGRYGQPNNTPLLVAAQETQGGYRRDAWSIASSLPK